MFGLKSVLISGCAITVILAAIVLTSMRCVRRSGYFEVFWNTHNLFFLFYAGLVFHGCRRGHPTFWMYFFIPGSIYLLDRLYR